MLEGIGAGGEGDDRGWDGWMASPTRWTWVWVNSRRWWWTGRPGVLQFMGHKESDTTERLRYWTEASQGQPGYCVWGYVWPVGCLFFILLTPVLLSGKDVCHIFLIEELKILCFQFQNSCSFWKLLSPPFRVFATKYCDINRCISWNVGHDVYDECSSWVHQSYFRSHF